MPRDPEAHLRELEAAAVYLMAKARDLSEAAYLQNQDLRFAVERSFIHIGEVMAQLRREFPALAAQFPNASRIVDFRNLIIHRFGTRTMPRSLSSLRHMWGRYWWKSKRPSGR